ncbi:MULTISPECIES: hypothetical protein [unclassified Streptomyces]|uniref:hypothetical protein n=1 Tax=unclassified Streptomyces TaxID=2593676 RepID=UPI002E2FC0E9|nr:hypothetical protein [Streptomyces sp. NBC_01431]
MDKAKNRARVKGIVVTAAAAALALTLTACGGSDGGKKNAGSSTSATPGGKTQSNAPDPQSDQVLATVQGENGIEMSITSAKRDTGGFVTVAGVVKNNGKDFYTMPDWQGDETELRNNGASMAGASLVDKAGKKRYLILRDTDGRCLCTKFSGLGAGKNSTFFAQFPAPPANTTEVDFQVPHMQSATIKISG